MKRTELTWVAALIAGVLGCSGDGQTILPDIVIDYGYTDTGSGDTAQPDIPVNDTAPADPGARDIGGLDNQEPVDVIVDTGPCTLACSAMWRCGPNPCGDGECAPGCDGTSATPVCNLITRLCEPEVCVSNCAGRVCGYDGCGGTCGENGGKCTDPEHCNYTTGQCGTQCYPACVGKQCGDDGCGGTCKPGCGDGVTCSDDGYCEQEGLCQATGSELKCEAEANAVTGGTGGSSGTTMTLYNYSEACGTVYNPGPEKAYKLVVDADLGGNLEVVISQSLPIMSNFLNLYLVEDTGSGCLAAGCIAATGDGNKTLTFEVPASATGHTYYLIADAGVRNNGTFSITIKKCGWNGFDADAVVTADQ